MQNFQGRRRWKKMVYSKITILLLLILVILMSRALWRIHQKNQLALRESSKAEVKFLELEKQKNDLADKVKWLSTTRGQEESVRQNFSVVKEGEKVILVVEAKEASTTDLKVVEKGNLLDKAKEFISNWWNIN